jgi:hypothetical protein
MKTNLLQRIVGGFSSHFVRLALLGLFSTVCVLHAAQAPLLWAKTVGENVIAIAVNRSGEVHVAGSLSGTMPFGSSNVTAIRSNTPFVATYSPNGDPLWWRAATTTNGARITDIGVAPSNDVVIVASCGNATSFDSLPIQTNSSLCVVRYKEDGNPRWLRQISCFPNTGPPRGTPMSIDGNGNVYLTATFYGSLSLEETNLVSTGTSTGSGDGFLIKFNPDGTLGWLRQLSANLVRPHGLGEDSKGNVYLTGHFQSNLNLITTNLISRGGTYDVFLVSYDRDGNLRWAVQGGGAGSLDESWSLAVSRQDKILVAGNFDAPMEFISRSFTNTTPGDLFLAQIDTAGQLQWLNQFGGGFGREQVAVDSWGNSYVAGFFASPGFFGNVVITNSGATNRFLAKYGPEGDFNWVQQFGAGFLNAIATDAAGNVVIGGAGTGVFGGTNLSSGGFLAKYGTTDVELSPSIVQTNLVLSWPSLAIGFYLEAKDSLSAMTWNEVTNTVTTIGSSEVGFQNVVTVPADRPARFFRLRRD